MAAGTAWCSMPSSRSRASGRRGGTGASASRPFRGRLARCPAGGDGLARHVPPRDASDATRSVVATQAGYDTGDIGWARVDASGAPPKRWHWSDEGFRFGRRPSMKQVRDELKRRTVDV